MERTNTSPREFLWNLSGFKKANISKSTVDEYHVTIIGLLILIVGIYATLAWTFFFQTVTENLTIAVVGGLFMGLFIVSFDRALIASMAVGNTNRYSVGFRLVLATLLGIFLAQPMILKFYEKDISREAQLLVDLKNQERKKELENTYAVDLDRLSNDKAALQQGILAKQEALNQAEQDFKSEMDGSGGTGRWGYSTVSKQKEKIYQRHQAEYETLLQNNQQKIATIDEEMDVLNTRMSEDFESYKANNTAFGTLIQAEALKSLLNKDETGSLKARYYLLAIILALIELSALIAKLLFNTKSYKTRVKTIVSTEVARSKAEAELTKKFFAMTEEVNEDKLEALMKDWKANSGESTQELYARFKKQLIINDETDETSEYSIQT